MDGKEIHEKYRTISDDIVIGHLETKVRTYTLIQSCRYPFDDFQFNMDVVTKWLSYGTLIYTPGFSPLDSKIENAIHAYALSMDAFKAGDIIHICHKEPFTYKDYILLSNEMVIDGYGVGCYLEELKDLSPYDRENMHYYDNGKSLICDLFKNAPVPDKLSWIDFKSYYHPDKRNAKHYQKECLKSYSNRIHEYEEEIEYIKKQIEVLENDKRQFNVRFLNYIKKIRQNAKKEVTV